MSMRFLRWLSVPVFATCLACGAAPQDNAVITDFGSATMVSASDEGIIVTEVRDLQGQLIGVHRHDLALGEGSLELAAERISTRAIHEIEPEALQEDLYELLSEQL